MTIAEEFKYFVESAPDYRDTWIIDDIRSREFSRLEESKQTYLDHTGAALYSRAQLRHFTHALSHSVIAAPNNGFSDKQSHSIEHCRQRFLRFFGADPKEYTLIFTSTVTQAMHTVACGYPFSANSQLLLTVDNHNCTDYLVQQAQVHKAQVTYAPMLPQTLQIDEEQLMQQLQVPAPEGTNRLLVFPAQSNLSGVRHSLKLISTAQELGWEVLLDATSYAPTAPLNMSRYHPEFLTLSFYKLFGFPSGLGALIIKRSALAKLYRKDGSSCAPPEVIDFLGIPSLEYGLDLLEEVSYEAISARTQGLTSWLIKKMKLLRHQNRKPAIAFYGAALHNVPHGPVIAFNFLNPEGKVIAHEEIKSKLEQDNVILGQGDFENPQLCALALNTSHPGQELPQQMWRVSLGLCSNFPDAFQFITLCKRLIGR